MQLLATIASFRLFRFGLLFFLGAPRPRVRLGFLEPSLLFGRSCGGLLGGLARFLFGIDSRLLFLEALLFLAPRRGFLLLLETLLLELCCLDALFFLAPLAVQLGLLFLGLLLENVTLDIRALLADFDIHGARTPLRARKPQLRLRLALQGNATRRRGIGGIARLPVAAPQMGQQFEFCVFANRIVRATDLDASLVKLSYQLVDRYFQYFSKLCNCHISHVLTPRHSALRPAPLPQTSAHAPS